MTEKNLRRPPALSASMDAVMETAEDPFEEHSVNTTGNWAAVRASGGDDGAGPAIAALPRPTATGRVVQLPAAVPAPTRSGVESGRDDRGDRGRTSPRALIRVLEVVEETGGTHVLQLTTDNTKHPSGLLVRERRIGPPVRPDGSVWLDAAIRSELATRCPESAKWVREAGSVSMKQFATLSATVEVRNALAMFYIRSIADLTSRVTLNNRLMMSPSTTFTGADQPGLFFSPMELLSSWTRLRSPVAGPSLTETVASLPVRPRWAIAVQETTYDDALWGVQDQWGGVQFDIVTLRAWCSLARQLERPRPTFDPSSRSHCIARVSADAVHIMYRSQSALTTIAEFRPSQLGVVLTSLQSKEQS